MINTNYNPLPLKLKQTGFSGINTDESFKTPEFQKVLNSKKIRNLSDRMDDKGWNLLISHPTPERIGVRISKPSENFSNYSVLVPRDSNKPLSASDTIGTVLEAFNLTLKARTNKMVKEAYEKNGFRSAEDAKTFLQELKKLHKELLNVSDVQK